MQLLNNDPRLLCFFAGKQFLLKRERDLLNDTDKENVPVVLHQQANKACAYLFQRNFDPMLALKNATGSRIVLARQSEESDEQGNATSIEVLEVLEGEAALFEFACESAEYVFARQNQFGYYKTPNICTQVVQARRVWLAGQIFDEQLLEWQALLKRTPDAYNGALPGTPWWSYYQNDVDSIRTLMGCANALAATEMPKMRNGDSDSSPHKLCSAVADWALAAAGRIAVALAWKMRAENIGSPPASFWNSGEDLGLSNIAIINEYTKRVDKGGLFEQSAALAERARAEALEVQKSLLLKQLNQMFFYKG